MSELYAVVDAAQDRRLYGLITESREFECLFAGDLAPVVRQVSPHVVRLADDTPLAEAWRREGWGRNWGILCEASASLAELRRHFRHFLQALLPNGRIVQFRFYDPRVWRTYMPTCQPNELARWFDAVDEFRAESADGQGMVKYRLRDGALAVEEIH
jgi:hypothetical protein